MPILGIIASQNYPRVTNSYESIATVTVGSGGSSTITFTSIPSTYKHLQVRFIGRNNISDTGDAAGLIVINSDTTSGNYKSHYLGGNGASAYAGNTSPSGAYGFLTTCNNNASNIFSVGVLDILDYASTSKNKTLRVLNGEDINGTGWIQFQSALWMNNTTAINRLDFTVSSGSYLQYSQAALYGIKD